MMQNLEFIGRLLLAGALGAVIGLEREYRAKVAGMRTHFLVALGSALIMIVSQWGFQDSAGVAGIRPGDAARVAAQIVSGIGFIGAGTIMMQKQAVRGLTTAAGLWVAAGIGMAVGGGLYVLGIVTMLLALAGLEIFQYLFRNMRTECLQLIFSTRNRNNLVKITNELNNNGYRVLNCAVTSEYSGKQEHLRVKMYLRLHPHSDGNILSVFLRQFPDIMVEKIE